MRSAGEDDRIRIAIFGWDLTGIARDVVRAHQRGVDVRVVADDQNRANEAYRLLRDGGVPVELCERSCVGGTRFGNRVMHNKFFLFDIGGTRSVAQSSSNLTDTQLRKANDMVRVTGDPKLYRFYLDYWNRLASRDGIGTGDDLQQRASLDTTAYLFPRAQGDPVLEILNNVTRCRDGHDTVWLAQSRFTPAREAIRNRLAEMAETMGCDVRAVVQHRSARRFVQSPTSGGYDLDNDTVRSHPVHHKVFIIDARYNGQWQQLVVTGSHNMHRGSLRTDAEAMLAIRNSFVFERYARHHEQLYRQASRRAGRLLPLGR